jgi:hypothetical protein
MRKILLLYIFLLFFAGHAQDTLTIEPSKKYVFSEKDIFVDGENVSQSKFSDKFKKKYKDEAFIYEEKTEEKNAWDRFKEWLASILQRIFKFSSERTSGNVVLIILKIVAVLVVAFVVYLIVKAILNKEGQWIFGKNSNKKIIYDAEIEKQLLTTDFEKLIAQSLAQGQQNLTIRYYYLWTLKKMSEKNLIVWDIEKTNADYLYELKNENHKNDFAYLSYLYNNIWYGDFEIDAATFLKAKNAFDNTIRTL